MKRSHGCVIVCIFLAVSAGCFKAVDPVDLPFEERLVIRGILEPGKPVDDIYIGRTLPISESYSQEKAAITDAVAYIRRGNDLHPLRYRGPVLDSSFFPVGYQVGLYAADSLIIESEREYEIVVRWKTLTASGKATIPPLPVIDSIQVSVDGPGEYGNGIVHISAFFEARASIGYSSSSDFYRYRDDVSLGQDLFQALATEQTVVTTTFSVYLKGTLVEDSTDFLLVAHEPAFFKYLASGGLERQPDDIFLPTKILVPEWNVIGDGVGIFFGRARTVKKVKYFRGTFSSP